MYYYTLTLLKTFNILIILLCILLSNIKIIHFPLNLFGSMIKINYLCSR